MERFESGYILTYILGGQMAPQALLLAPHSNKIAPSLPGPF